MNALAIEAARDMLHQALRLGEPTNGVRKEVAAAEAAEARSRAASERVLAQAEASRAKAIRQAVDGECAQLRQAIMAECAAVLPGFDVAVTIETHRLVMLLEAKARRDEAESARAELANDLETLRARLADVESQISAIHASDDRSDTALGRVHLLGLDKADIQALIEAASAQLEAIALPGLADEERAWQQAQLAARYGARHQIILELESRLLKMAGEARDAVGPGAWVEYRFQPSPLLRQVCANSIL
jgi:hypothetical protein